MSREEILLTLILFVLTIGHLKDGRIATRLTKYFTNTKFRIRQSSRNKLAGMKRGIFKR